ncbi:MULTISPECIES: hypothetical protein [Providencia]|uniref:hypothetical protein n=1 Tax=Providencia TaxID=586 RepID=UPI0012B573FF|nr:MULTISPECIES: hypothetical protein [Providencia]MTC71526.1 hypothetical protein [Providencia sp. wls1914]MTC74324.1 hypothetical protein [Providencia sp. wls1919]QLR03351.1 hypothetical protein H0913_10245 [Providencia rettgeri]
MKFSISAFKNGTLLLLFSLLWNTSTALAKTATLKLQGVVDLTIAERVPREIPATLTGDVFLDVTPVYSNTVKKSWNFTIPIVGFSQAKNSCDMSGLHQIPYFYHLNGVPLTNRDSGEVDGYLIPNIDYQINIMDHGTNLEPVYAGTFFTRNFSSKLIEIPQVRVNGVCLYPQDNYRDIPSKGRKQLRFSVNQPQTIYLSQDLVSGKIAFNSTKPFYLMTGGFDLEARDTILLNIEADLTILRFCEVTAVTNNHIQHTFVDDMEAQYNSSITLSCNGTKQDTIRMVAKAKETDFDPSNPKKLLLKPVDEGMKVGKLPWVLGGVSELGKSLKLNCNDDKNSQLMSFNGEEVDLGIKNTQKPILLNVTWALCRTPEVKGGEYQGKADLAFFIKS